MRVMLDTNILVSAIFFQSDITTQLMSRLENGHQAVICDYVLEELNLVADRKFPQKKWRISHFLLNFPFEMAHTPKELKLEGFPSVRDKKDTPILATAILEDIDVFVTGDKDFLVLDVDKPEIMTMTEFIEAGY